MQEGCFCEMICSSSFRVCTDVCTHEAINGRLLALLLFELLLVLLLMLFTLLLLGARKEMTFLCLFLPLPPHYSLPVTSNLPFDLVAKKCWNVLCIKGTTLIFFYIFFPYFFFSFFYRELTCKARLLYLSRLAGVRNLLAEFLLSLLLLSSFFLFPFLFMLLISLDFHYSEFFL